MARCEAVVGGKECKRPVADTYRSRYGRFGLCQQHIHEATVLTKEMGVKETLKRFGLKEKEVKPDDIEREGKRRQSRKEKQRRTRVWSKIGES